MGSQDLWILTACVQNGQLQRTGQQTIFLSIAYVKVCSVSRKILLHPLPRFLKFSPNGWELL